MEAKDRIGFLGNDNYLAQWREDRLKPITSVPTPFAAWDVMCRDAGGGRGLAKGWHIVIGGLTGAGKSLFGLNLCASVLKGGSSVGVVSLEMSPDELATRFLSIYSGEPVSKMEHGTHFDIKTHRLVSSTFNAHFEATSAAFYFNLQIPTDLHEIEAVIRDFVELGRCRMIIVDYIQLAWSDAGSMFDRITEVSHRLMQLAQYFGITTVAISQFNRTVNRFERPSKFHLMGGGPIEQDAHQVLLLDHTRTRALNDKRRVESYIIVDKNRHGPIEDIPVVWDYNNLTVEQTDDWEEINREDRVA